MQKLRERTILIMTKYTTVKVSGIITQIAKTTDIKGYTEGVLEVFLPDEDKMTDKESRQWIKENNLRMEKICAFLNENDL